MASSLRDLRCRACGRKPTRSELANVARDMLSHGLKREDVAGWYCAAHDPGQSPRGRIEAKRYEPMPAAAFSDLFSLWEPFKRDD